MDLFFKKQCLHTKCLSLHQDLRFVLLDETTLRKFGHYISLYKGVPSRFLYTLHRKLWKDKCRVGYLQHPPYPLPRESGRTNQRDGWSIGVVSGSDDGTGELK